MSDEMILAIRRSTQHSATHKSNDALMFDLACNQLRGRGFDVEVIEEDQLATYLDSASPRYVISMAQRPENTALLTRVESAGGIIVNSFESILNTYRVFLALRLSDEKLFAQTRILTSLVEAELEDFEEAAYAMLSKTLGEPFWLKRGDVHAAHPDDVLLVQNREEFSQSLTNFRSRSVETAIVQEHLPGRVVKFYAISGGRFFHTQDFLTGEPLQVSGGEFQQEADRIASILGLTIYGGDAVFTESGQFRFIDFNAWPSFGTVRDQAVPVMVDAILEAFSLDSARMETVGRGERA